MRYTSDKTLVKDEDGLIIKKDSLWWFKTEYTDAFQIFDTQKLYGKMYYDNPPEYKENINTILNTIFNYSKLYNKNIKNIVEVGSGGGWFSTEILNRGYDLTIYEGSKYGIEKCINSGIPKEFIIQHDLREVINNNEKYDLCICMEVSEHIEPPFAAILIKNLTSLSDLIYFTFSEDNVHIHHCNPQPLIFWQNLFYYYGFDLVRKIQTSSTLHRANGIFFKKNI